MRSEGWLVIGAISGRVKRFTIEAGGVWKMVLVESGLFLECFCSLQSLKLYIDARLTD